MKRRPLAAILGLVVIAALVLVMFFLLAGCSGGDEPRGSVAPLESAEPTPKGTVEAQPSGEDGGEELFRSGSVDGGTYTNDMLGLGCTLDSDWTFASEDEIAATFGMAKELIEQAETGIDLEGAETFTDLYVYADDGLVNMNVQVQRLGVLESGVIGNTDEDEVLDEILKVLEPTMTSVYGEGSEVTMEKVDATFLGEGHRAISIVTAIEGIDMYQKQVYLPRGRYLAIVTCTSVGVDMTDDLLSLYYEV